MSEPDKSSESDSSSESERSQMPPEFGSAFDYDATAEASLSEPPATSETGPVTGAVGSGSGSGPGWDVHSGVGNGPGWGEAPSYPPPSAPENPSTPQSPISFEKQSPGDPYGQPSPEPYPPAGGYGAGPVYGPPDPNYSQPGQYDQQTQGYPPPPPESWPQGYPGQPQGFPGQPQGPGFAGYGQQGYGPPQGYPVGGYPGSPYGVDPTAPYGRHPVTGEPLSDKSKLTGGLLGILLGPFGAGRFYLNQPGIAVAQIAVTWLTCGIGGIWPLIDGIMMLTGSVRDEHGRPLRD
ncbi:TM2 domain-containing protein [Rhodococcus sp. P1Y]|uniref:TM2 domain-containing protein n=1 Tax=Rhodococcus sp. P1Y TaxID=1302308 RepID=UPI000EB0073D|nr:TM2 domain-containing protein [Rhodococcus sp. P1Y]AYJ49935.1 NINE protein [Rhodococcus sp. P1Y]